MSQTSSAGNPSLIHRPPALKVVATGIEGAEGPAVAPDGTLFVVSATTGRIIAVGKDGTLREHARTDGRPNGLAFDRNGVMHVADAGRKALLVVSESGKTEPIVDSFEGSPLEGPNDLAFLPDGSLVFSDPIRLPPPDPAISPVYRVSSSGSVSRFFSDLAYPNGVALAASGDELLVSEMRAHRIVGLGLGDDMNAVSQRLVRRFREPAEPDGMAVDEDGRILVALPGLKAIAVVGLRNELAELFHIPEWKPSNLCFGGGDRRTVFVTSESDGSVYSFRHDKPGIEI